MRRENLEYATIRYGTPLYAFDLDEIKRKSKYFRERLWENAGLCFAMKANPFLLENMADLVDRIEVCSMGEFEICRKHKIPKEKLFISGVLKKKEDFYEILDYCRGESRYSLESLSQLYDLLDWCKTNDEEVKAYLRLTSGNQFGMDEKTIEGIIDLRRRFPRVKIMGIHYFSSTQKKKEKIEKELRYLDDFLLQVQEKTGYPIQELEYGPGIAARYFEGQKEHLEEDLTLIRESVSQMKWQGKITLEMGRGLAASCGYYFTTVRDIKCNQGKNYCLVDGGIHQINYDGQIRGMYQPFLLQNPDAPTGQEKEFTICGSLCTYNDVLVQKVKLRNLQPGNVLIFKNAGAYAMTEGMALFLSHELPGILLYSEKKGWKCLRQQTQTYPWNTGAEDNWNKE